MTAQTTTMLPLRVSIESTTDVEEIRAGFPETTIAMPTLKRTTAKFAAISSGVITEYTFDAVGPVTLTQHIGELNEDDRKMLRETRRLINDLLDE